MKEKNKKILLFIIVLSALGILISAGLTFAYFQTSISSKENAVDVTSAVFEIGLEEDNSLIKNNIIPSIKDYVDIATNNDRRDSNKNFLKPVVNEETGEVNKAGTTCIDDNGNEICSVYTFRIINKTKDDMPLYLTLTPSINTFENLYLKVIDKEGNEIMPATHIVDSRYQLDENGNYLKNGDDLIKKDNFDSLKQDPIVLTGINSLKGSNDLEKPIKDEYSIIMWINEIHDNQNVGDGGKIFASTLNITSSYDGTGGITGVFSAFGTENLENQ